MNIYETIFLKPNESRMMSEAILYEGKTYSYGEIDGFVHQMSSVLAEKGVCKNSKVMLSTENPFNFLIEALAISKMGAVFFPFFSGSTVEQMDSIISRYDINYLITGDFVEKREKWEVVEPKLINGMGVLYRFSENIDPILEDIELVLFTSGTTSIPKAVMLTFTNVYSNVVAISDYLQLQSSDKILLIKNMCHSSTVVGELLTGLFKGCTIYLTRTTPFAQETLRIINDNKITVFFSVPTILRALVHLLLSKKKEMSTLRVLNFYGASTSEQLIEDAIKVLPRCNLMYSYGLTEASPRVTYISMKDWKHKKGSSGKPIEGVGVFIVDNLGRNVTNTGRSGEIVVCGPNVMAGYYRDEEKTNSKIRRGLLYTGDIGHIDSDGYLFVTGRKDNMFIYGGKNIYPEEIEGVLTSHSSIKDALVKPQSDAYGNVQINAWISIQEGCEIDLTDVYNYCKERMELYKVPNKIYVIDELAKTASGKIKRN